MFKQQISDNNGDCMLSPKETQQRKVRSKTIRKIDDQIQKIKSLNSLQSQQYKQFIEKIVFIEEVYKRENVDLKSALEVMTEKYNSLQSIYHSLKEELQNSYDITQTMSSQNKRLMKQVAKLKSMIHNQQNLIDQYRKNIQEQRIRPPINIDKNCIKVISQSHLRLIRFQDRAHKKMVEIQNEYVFQKIFNQNETQHQVFRQLSEFIKQSVDGKNVCLCIRNDRFWQNLNNFYFDFKFYICSFNCSLSRVSRLMSSINFILDSRYQCALFFQYTQYYSFLSAPNLRCGLVALTPLKISKFFVESPFSAKSYLFEYALLLFYLEWVLIRCTVS